jgi:hypothetical protein
MTFRTHPKPSNVIYFELVLLPRSLPNTPDNVKRASNLFAAFQAFGASEEAVKELGLSWHVTPEPGSPSGKGEAKDEDVAWGTKVEVLGQFSGTEEEFEGVIQAFEHVLRENGETEFQRGHRQLSECLFSFG